MHKGQTREWRLILGRIDGQVFKGGGGCESRVDLARETALWGARSHSAADGRGGTSIAHTGAREWFKGKLGGEGDTDEKAPGKDAQRRSETEKT